MLVFDWGYSVINVIGVLFVPNVICVIIVPNVINVLLVLNVPKWL